MLSERYVAACGQELAGELGLAPESVYDPALRWLEAPAQFGYDGMGAHGVYYQGLAQGFAQIGLYKEYLFLALYGGAAQSVDAAFAYGYDAVALGALGQQVYVCD